MKFKVGDIVKLTHNYTDTSMNPLWEGIYGKVIGKICNIKDYIREEQAFKIWVKWDLGTTNLYRPIDLEFPCREDRNCKLCQYRLKCITM